MIYCLFLPCSLYRHNREVVWLLKPACHPLLVRWVHHLVYLEHLEVFTFISIRAILEVLLLFRLPLCLLLRDPSHLRNMFAYQLAALASPCGNS